MFRIWIKERIPEDPAITGHNQNFLRKLPVYIKINRKHQSKTDLKISLKQNYENPGSENSEKKFFRISDFKIYKKKL